MTSFVKLSGTINVWIVIGKEQVITMKNNCAHKKIIGLLIVLAGSVAVAMSPAKGQAAAVDAALSTREAYVGVPLVMHLRISNAGHHAQPVIPEVAGLDVESAGVPSQSSQTTIINGRRSARTSITYAWQLTPRREGTFRIPSVEVEVDGRIQHTRPLSFLATKSETGDLLFVEVAGKQEKIYVGQPLDLTLQVLIKPFHDDRYDLTLSPRDMWNLISIEHSNWGAFEETLRDLAENQQAVVGRKVLRDTGQDGDAIYYLYEIPATIYPTRPGEVDMSEVQVVMQYPTSLAESRDFFSAGQLTVRQARPIVEDARIPTTEVVAIPMEGRPADYRGTVGHYEIITRAAPVDIKAGDPITLQIGIRGDGPMELVQAPPLAELAEFSKDFKIPDEALAGVVEDDVKVFSVSIRPRREGIPQIPAIPLSYFDPDTEEFATAWSEPIAIVVRPADNLALSSIVAAGGRQAVTDVLEAGGEPGSQVSLNNYKGSDLLVSVTPRKMWPLVAGLLFAPLLFTVVALIKYAPQITGILQNRRLAALRRADRGLQAARTVEDVAGVMRTYVADRVGVSATGLTRTEAVAALRKNGLHVGSEDLDALLAECETSCYAGFSGDGIDALMRRAKSCLAALRRQRLDSRGHGLGKRTWKPFFSKATTGALILAACLVWGDAPAGSSIATAAELNPQQAEQILHEATHAYEQGQAAADDAAIAKESFTVAASKYQTLVDDGIDNGRLYFNLAGAYLQSGDPGRALANYERAALLLPGDSEVVANREHTLAVLSGEESATGQSLNARILNWNKGLSVDARIIVGMAAWSVLWLTMAVSLLISRRGLRAIAISAAVVFVLSAGSLGVQWSEPVANDRGVVIAANAQLHEGNGEGFAVMGQAALNTGTTFEIVQQRGNWLEVRTSDGRVGWLAKKNAELISSRDWRAT